MMALLHSDIRHTLIQALFSGTNLNSQMITLKSNIVLIHSFDYNGYRCILSEV